MNAFYQVFLNDIETGPFTVMDLHRMAERNEIGKDSQVRKIGTDSWGPWWRVEQENRAFMIQQQAAASAPSFTESISDKSRGTYIILGLLFGCLGFHNFYARYYSVGFIQFFATALLCWLVWPIAVVGVWVIIEVMTVTQDADGAPFS